MAELARVGVAAAPACPNCKNRLSELPIDDLSGGDEYQCLFCSEIIRIPQQVLDRLREQREAFLREHGAPPTWLQRLTLFFRRLLGRS